MTTHAYNFDGGEELAQMGATWFVSYSYFNHIDSNHTNWANVTTVESRASTYKKTTYYHIYWLKKILEMNDKRLNTNTIDLDATQTKEMARQILEKQQ